MEDLHPVTCPAYVSRLRLRAKGRERPVDHLSVRKTSAQYSIPNPPETLTNLECESAFWLDTEHESIQFHPNCLSVDPQSQERIKTKGRGWDLSST